MIRRVPLALAAALVAGCAGERAEFACPGYPGHPLCLPPSEIYRLSDGDGAAPAAMPRLAPSAFGSGRNARPDWTWTPQPVRRAERP